MAVLVTGGAGYIGSHTCVELLDAGLDIVVVDNLNNSNAEVIRRIQEITHRAFPFYQVDLLNESDLEHVFLDHDIDAVIHFAGLKAVGESVAHPIDYYQNNITGTLTLCRLMDKFNVKRIVFSSSATVYGANENVPLSEAEPLAPVSPYGRTKAIIEQILQDVYVSDSSWSIAILRYFNPVGAHESGRIGEDPSGVPNNLVPYITQVAIGQRPELRVFGDDYATPDGTGIRDYIHITDLAQGHMKALDKVLSSTGIAAYNLGTGIGYSVLNLVHTFEEASGVKIPYRIIERRPGDVAVSYSDPHKAETELGWKAAKGLFDMCADAWRWQRLNPRGYQSTT